MNRPAGRLIMIGIVLACLLQPAPAQARAGDAASIDIPLSALNGGRPVGLVGLITSTSLEIPIPDTSVVISGSWIQFSVDSSAMLDRQRSNLTISLNGHQVGSYRLSQLGSQPRQVTIPAVMFQQGSNDLVFTATLYLPEDNQTTCSNWDNPARWLTLDPASFIHLPLAVNDLPYDLSSFPDGFTERLDQYRSQDGWSETLFVLPDDPGPDDLTGVVSVAYLLGGHSGVDIPWQPRVVSIKDFKPALAADRSLVLVRTLADLLQAPAQAELGVVALRNSPWDSTRPALYVGDFDAADGFTPAQLLGDPARQVQLVGNLAYLESGQAAPPEPFRDAYTFEDLGYLERTVRGIGQGSLVYRVFIPYDVDPLVASLNLVISHAPDLDVEGSSILVYLNGFTVAGIAPTARSANFAPIEISLPSKRLRPGVNFIRVLFDLQTPYSSCERAPESVWATVHASSTLQVTFRDAQRNPSLSDFPMPYSDSPGFAFVVPDEPGPATIERLASLAYLFGQNAQLANDPPIVITASQFDPAAAGRDHIILVGLPAENGPIMAINRLLPQPFTADGLGLEPGYGVYLPEPIDQASLGLVQSLASPWSESGALLVVTGTDEQGLSWAWDLLLDPARAQDFSGNVVLVGSDGRSSAPGAAVTPQAVFENTPEVSRLPWVGRLLQQLEPSDIFPALAALEGALLILLGLLALFRRRDSGQ